MANFLIRSCTASSKSSAFSSSSAIYEKLSATIVLRTTFGLATEAEEPRLLNSNLFPVNANGDVLFLSVASFLKLGIVLTPICIFSAFLLLVASPDTTSCSTTSSNWSPRNIEIIAGGASFAPNLWSLPTLAADSLSKSA